MAASTKAFPHPAQRIATASGRDVCRVLWPQIKGETVNPKANARLIASSYNALDKAGRELGVDAVALAEGLDLGALIRAARALVDSTEADPVFERIALRNALSKIPPLG